MGNQFKDILDQLFLVRDISMKIIGCCDKLIFRVAKKQKRTKYKKPVTQGTVVDQSPLKKTFKLCGTKQCAKSQEERITKSANTPNPKRKRKLEGPTDLTSHWMCLWDQLGHGTSTLNEDDASVASSLVVGYV
jgi:hypothetical protein